MSRMYGKWFEADCKKEAAKFAKDSGLKLWLVTQRADRSKAAQIKMFYAGTELPSSMGKDIAAGKTKAEELGGNGRAATPLAVSPLKAPPAPQEDAPPARRRGRPPKTLYPVAVVPPQKPRGRKRQALGGSPLRNPPQARKEETEPPSSPRLPVAAFSGEISADAFATLIADKVVTSLLAMIQEIPSPSWEKAKAAVSLTETEQVEEVVDVPTDDALPMVQEVPEQDEREFLAQEDAPAGDVLDKAALTDAEGYVGDAAGDDEEKFETWDGSSAVEANPDEPDPQTR